MRLPGGPRVAEPGAEDEEELPGERVEEPVLAGRVAPQREAVALDDDPEHEGGDEGGPGTEAERQEDEREDGEEDDVERQDVEEGRLEAEDEGVEDRDMGLGEEVGDARLLGVDRVLER